MKRRSAARTSPWSPAPKRRVYRGELRALGSPRPALLVMAWAEDFSLLNRTPRRMRIARNRIYVLS